MNTFTIAQWQALSRDEQRAVQAVIYALNGDCSENQIDEHDNEKFIDDWFQGRLDLVTPAAGCVPDGYEDSIEQAIIRKFYGIYAAARDIAEAELKPARPDLRVVIEPSTNDYTIVVIYDAGRRRHVHYETGRKAWLVGYETLHDLAEHVSAIAEIIVKSHRKLNQRKPAKNNYRKAKKK